MTTKTSCSQYTKKGVEHLQPNCRDDGDDCLVAPILSDIPGICRDHPLRSRLKVSHYISQLLLVGWATKYRSDSHGFMEENFSVPGGSSQRSRNKLHHT